MSAENKPAADDRLPGRKVGGYTITRRVGQGGMGVVYEAKHERIGQRAAVKVLHKELSSDEKVLQRFFNEAKAISVAQHSSIVKIFDYGQLDDGTAYILMEFLEGEPLLNRMERAQKEGTGLTLRLVVELGRQISAALALIHQKGIVHRDLKPENIFIVPDPVAPLGERVKLLDFGIAKFLEGPVRKTTVGMILGTPLYMSPEQCEGSEDLDEKVDVYALGVILYEMLAGHLPFTADTAASLMRQHMFKEPPPLAGQVKDLPADLDALVHEMLAKARTDRPTMLEVSESLEALLPQIGDQQTNPHAPMRTTSGRRRRSAQGAGEPPADPLARTLGDSSKQKGAAEEEPLDPLAQTQAGPTSQPQRAVSGKNNLPGQGGSGPAAALADGVSGTPQPLTDTMAGASAKKRLPLVVASAVAIVLVLAMLALRLRTPPQIAQPTPPVETISKSATASERPQPAPEPSAKPASPAATTTAAADADEAESKKASAKKAKGRPVGKKRVEDSEAKKADSPPAAPHKPKSGGGDESDVWR